MSHTYKFYKAVAYADNFIQEAIFKKRLDFDQVKDNVMHAFASGSHKVHLYYDGRKGLYIEILRKDYSKDQILDGYITIHKKNKIIELEKRKEGLCNEQKRINRAIDAIILDIKALKQI